MRIWTPLLNRSMSHVVILVAILLTASIVNFIPKNIVGGGEGSYPPPASGDWSISNNTYVSNETVLLTGNLTIEFGGTLTLSNVTLVMNCSAPGQFRIQALTGGSLRIDKSNITAALDDGSHNYGFVAEEGSNLTITSSRIQYVGWSMDFTQSNGIVLRTQNATIRDCNVSHNYAGVTVYQVAGTVTIKDNNVSWSKRNGITVIGSDVVLTGNNISYSGMIMDSNWGAFAGHGILLANGSTGSVYDNNLNENYWDGLYVYKSSDITIGDNYMLSNRNEGVEFEGATYITFEGNNASHNLEFAGLSLWHSDYNTISNNTFYQNGNNGLYMNNTWDNALINNTAIGSQRYHGFSIENSYFASLQWNNISGVARHGVWIGSSDGCTLMDNNISSNDWGGVFIGGGMGHSLFVNNIHNNSGEGLYVESSPYNAIVGNRFSENLAGVSLLWSVNNTVFWNSFISNGNQAYDNQAVDSWDNGYPYGGNYWSDYTGFDFFNGPNQDQPGSDRIGDMPYVIDSNSQDDYPLMGPFDFFSPGPPTNVSASLSGENSVNVTVSWNLSWNDQFGGIVTNYAIYCGSEFDPDGLGYTYLSDVPAGNSSYVHENAGYGNLNSYYYMIAANSTLGQSVKGGNQAGKFTRNLEPGIHLLSSPLFLGNVTLVDFLKTVSFTEVWHYDSTWKSYSNNKGFQIRPKFRHDLAFWVNVDLESDFTIAGKVAPRFEVELKAGWNLVGYPSPLNMTSAQSFAGIPIREFEGFDANATPYHLRRMNLSDDLVPGYGYWVQADADFTWIVTS